MGSFPSTSSGMLLATGATGVKRSLGTSLGMILSPESLVNEDASISVMPPPNETAEDRACDSFIPPLTVTGVTRTQGNFNDNINRAPADDECTSAETSFGKEFSVSNGTWGMDFLTYARFLRNPNAGVGPENNDIPDSVKFVCLSTMVKFLQQQLERATEATSLELTKLKEAHEVEMTSQFSDFEKEVNEFHVKFEAKIRKLNRQLEEVSKEHSALQLEVQHGKEKAQKMDVEVDHEKIPEKPEMTMSEDVKAGDMTATEAGLESKLCNSQGAGRASDQEVVQQLMWRIQEKDKALEESKLETSHLMAKCQKLEAQLAQIERSAARESSTSGSYASDRPNPSTLEEACKSVDKATDSIIMFLHTRSILSKARSTELPDEYMDSFLGHICSAKLADFSLPGRVKYAWGHWICEKMFHDFEHVFFDGDDRPTRSSPLDSRIHASECFRSFQQKEHMPPLKLYRECDMFRGFCEKKYSALIEGALHLRSAGNFGRSDDEIFQQCFLDVAKAVWLLHELAFSFDPPASILRMAPGLPFDKQYHESVVLGADNNGMPQVVLLMIRPAFRLRNSIIRSRVLPLEV